MFKKQLLRFSSNVLPANTCTTFTLPYLMVPPRLSANRTPSASSRPKYGKLPGLLEADPNEPQPSETNHFYVLFTNIPLRWALFIIKPYLDVVPGFFFKKYLNPRLRSRCLHWPGWQNMALSCQIAIVMTCTKWIHSSHIWESAGSSYAAG